MDPKNKANTEEKRAKRWGWTRFPLHCGSSWIQQFLNQSTMDFGDTQDESTFCFIELAFGHLRLSGPYVFGSLTQSRAAMVSSSPDSQCGLLPPDSLRYPAVDYTTFQSPQDVTLFVEEDALLTYFECCISGKAFP